MNLTSKQNELISNIYNNRRLRNKAILEQRIEEVYEAVPEIEEINRKIASVSISAAKLAIDGDKEALKSLASEIELLSNDKRVTLAGAGYPIDYLDEIFDCPKCHDTGYINGKDCDCLKRTVVTALYSQSNLKDVLSRENFETFNFDYYDNDYVDEKTGKTASENIEDIVDFAHSYIKNFKKDKSSLLFYGSAGTGKTFLINCIAKELIENAFSVIYLSAVQFFDILADESFNNGKSSAYKSVSLSEILDCDLLVIDDLGTEMPTSFTGSALFNCLNERLLRQKATIISTNLGIGDIKQVYTERIFSRTMGNFKLFKFFGDDIRIKKQI
ncbi:MAG: AAA family ATPase [Lachnospiraceae bacterium]|nr:AAA family ATPase [Lachnospiraceae bacterium]